MGKAGLTAETLRTRRKDFLIKKYSDLCELRASAVNHPTKNLRTLQNFQVQYYMID
jgi:hypothetical protein